MPGLELIGPIAGCPRVISQDPVVAGVEETGLFVAGDAGAIRAYSGMDLGWRWLVRGQGPLVKKVAGWPLSPRGATFDYFPDEQSARAYYAALRQHAFATTPRLVPQDTRQNFPLNVPSAYAESLWVDGQEAMRLIIDRMADLQVFRGNTQCIGLFEATPRGAPLVSYFTQNDVLYLAVARGATGGAEHVVIVFSDEHKPEPIIPEGLPRAEWMTKFNRAGLQFPSNLLVVQWGRLSGTEVLAAEDQQNPAGSLSAKMQGRVAMPIASPPAIAERLGNVPAAYAVRLEPGSYTATYYELMGTPYGGFSCCAISREGAPSFLPVVVGNAGGIVHGGLTVEQYAMLSVERDNLVMREGPTAVFGPNLAAVCQKYGVPFEPGGRAGRISGWELMIQGDAAFSAQWAIQRGIATMRLQGQEPNQAQIQAMAQQQQAVTDQLEKHAERRKNLNQQIEEAAVGVIGFALGQTPEAVLAEARRLAPDAKPADVFFRALRILRTPGEKGLPKFDAVDKRLDPLVRARWLVLDEGDRKFEGGTVEKYIKSEIDDIYPKNGLKVPGFFGFLGRL